MLFRHLYTIVYLLLLPLIVLRLLWRSIKAPAYRQRIAERFAIFKVPDFAAPSIWLHAVSVGETLAAAPLIKALQKQYPSQPIVITTTTPTGSARARALFGDSVYHVYTPYDIPWIVNAFIKKVKPAIAIVMETELWPNMIACCHKKNIPLLIANARLSEKSATGYQRFASLSHHMLQQISAIAAQNESDAQRFTQLGLPEKNLHVCGSIKFDLELDDITRRNAADLRNKWDPENSRVVWLAASTHSGEDEIILEVLRRLKLKLNNILLVLVPRHPERFDDVFELCKSWKLNVSRRSLNEPVHSFTDVVLGDTMGELLTFCGACDMAFVGGSLIAVGGHNMIEPAAWGKPVVSGKYLHNFAEISQLLIDAGGMKVCETENELYKIIKSWSVDEFLRQQAGQSAKQIAEKNKGALQKILAIIGELKK